MPDDYYVSQYSGEEIDAAVGRAATGGALDKRIATFVNPNLLDNWYFVNPVNQRGKTEYSIVGALVYSIDRWRVYAGSSANQSAVTIDNGSLHVKLATPFGRFDQLVENYKQLVGKQLTFTMLFEEAVARDVALVANQQDIQYNASCMGKRLASVTFAITETAGRLYVGIQNNDSVPVTVKPIAAKIELGNQQTLAHQENGNWVLNEIPDYGEQLAKCQRYLFSAHDPLIPYACVGSGYISNDGTTAIIIIPLPVALRAIPSVIVKGKIRVNMANGSIGVMTAAGVYNTGRGCIAIHGTVTNGAAGVPCYALLEVEDDILLSAEL